MAAAAAVVVGLLLAPAAPAAAGQGPSTLFGATVQMRPHETWDAAVHRADEKYGRLRVLRVFQESPNGWDAGKWADAVQGRSGVISFRVPPKAVLSGKYDAAFRTFFRNAPDNRRTWWTYYHEPDVAHAQGRLPLGQYRAAFRHVARLAQQAHNPQLKTTLIMVGYSATPGAHRSIRDYWPGSDLTDVIAWDVYNDGAYRDGEYGGTHQLALDRAAAAAVGKPWGVAEFGSPLLHGDDGTRRAAWITAFSRYAYSHGAAFVSYFDSDTYGQGSDMRLNDAPSERAWRRIVTDQRP